MNEKPNEHAQTEDFEFEALRAANNYRHVIARAFAPYLHGRVLEVGAGIGQMTELLRVSPAIQHLLSVEPDAHFCRKFRKTFPNQPLHEGTIQSVTDHQPWDAIISINVLEHIRHDEQELAQYHQHLRPASGHLCLLVPARQELYAQIDKDFGHHRRYAKPALRKNLESSGFKIISLRYFNCAGYFAWWFNFCVLKKRCFDPATVRLFDRMIFPCAHGLESRIGPPPFGQSLIAVCQAV